MSCHHGMMRLRSSCAGSGNTLWQHHYTITTRKVTNGTVKTYKIKNFEGNGASNAQIPPKLPSKKSQMLKNYLAALSACTFTGAFAVAALATMLGKVPTVTGIGLVCISLLLTALSASAIED